MNHASALELQNEILAAFSEATFANYRSPRRTHLHKLPKNAFSVGVAGSKSGSFHVTARTYDQSPALKRRLKEVGGQEIEVIPSGVPRLLVSHRRTRPVVSGLGIGHIRMNGYGTLGCFVKDSDGTTYLLSNNHVIAELNEAKLGDPVVQPGRSHGGRGPRDTIANLSRFQVLRSQASSIQGQNLDAAIAQLATGAAVQTGNLLQVDAGVHQFGQGVHKSGATTGRTVGVVTQERVRRVPVRTPRGIYIFDNVFEVQGLDANPFSAPGDSGSVIWSEDGNQPIGLLFAGGSLDPSTGKVITLALPMQAVLSSFDVEVVVPN